MINVIACGSITVTQVSAKGGSNIVTREIKRLSGRWRKRLNREVNLLTWKGNKRRKKAKVVLLFGGGGRAREGRGKRKSEGALIRVTKTRGERKEEAGGGGGREREMCM